MEIDRPSYEEDVTQDLLPLRAFLVETKSLRRFATGLSLVFADPDVIVAIATIHVTATESMEGEENTYPPALGRAAAALRPALLEQASKRMPPRVEVAEVVALHKLPELQPLAGYVTMDVAQRISSAFNKRLEGAGAPS